MGVLLGVDSSPDEIVIRDPFLYDQDGLKKRKE